MTSSKNISKIKEVNKSYKYKLYPSFEQGDYLNFQINSSRFIFNKVKEIYEYDRDWIKCLTNSPKVNYFLNRTISKYNGQYYVSINATKSIVMIKPKTGRVVGIDLGIKDTITIGEFLNKSWKTGKVIYKELDDSISRLQQIKECRILGVKNYSKTIAKLNKAYNSKKKQDSRFLHKTTTKIVLYFDKIIVGNVNSKLGLSNKHLSKTTSDQHWFEIKRQLEYKSDWYGKDFKIVDEKYTSMTCSECGYQLPKSPGLGVRYWICDSYGTHLDRDVNAVINIQTVGTMGIVFGKTNI